MYNSIFFYKNKNFASAITLLTFSITVTFAPKSANTFPTKGTGASPENSNTFNPFKGILPKQKCSYKRLFLVSYVS